MGFASLYPSYIYICDAKGKTEAAQALVRAHSHMESDYARHLLRPARCGTPPLEYRSPQ
jgi:hypothetical protein